MSKPSMQLCDPSSAPAPLCPCAVHIYALCCAVLCTTCVLRCHVQAELLDSDEPLPVSARDFGIKSTEREERFALVNSGS